MGRQNLVPERALQTPSLGLESHVGATGIATKKSNCLERWADSMSQDCRSGERRLSPNRGDCSGRGIT